jgi:hypothetical protein
MAPALKAGAAIRPGWILLNSAANPQPNGN